MNWISPKYIQVYKHLLCWSLIWATYVFFFSYNSSQFGYALFLSTVLLPITMSVTYLTIYRLIPKYLYPGHYLQFGVYMALSILITAFLILLFLILSVAYIDQFRFTDLPPFSRNLIYLLMLVYYVVLLASFITVWRNNMQQLVKNENLQRQIIAVKLAKQTQQLNYLKQQLQPHFLFNSLNTIYGLALQQSTKTPNVVLQLSGLLDYTLYTAEKSLVTLAEEIKHLSDYIELEKIRFQDNLTIDLQVDISNNNLLIAPMLLLPIIENVFKHAKPINEHIRVKIMLSASDNTFNCIVGNTCKSTKTQDGIGLNNCKKRLDILYPNKHNLLIQNKDNWFEVNLSITLQTSLNE